MSIPAPVVVDTHGVTVADPINVRVRSASADSAQESDDEKSLGIDDSAKHEASYAGTSAHSSEEDLVNK